MRKIYKSHFINIGMADTSEIRDVLPVEERYHPGIGAFEKTHRESLDHPEEFWSKAATVLDWYKTWDKVLDNSNPPFYKWFINGKLNISFNAVDRHITSHRRNKAAYMWIGETCRTATLEWILQSTME